MFSFNNKSYPTDNQFNPHAFLLPFFRYSWRDLVWMFVISYAFLQIIDYQNYQLISQEFSTHTYILAAISSNLVEGSLHMLLYRLCFRWFIGKQYDYNMLKIATLLNLLTIGLVLPHNLFCALGFIHIQVVSMEYLLLANLAVAYCATYWIAEGTEHSKAQAFMFYLVLLKLVFRHHL
jgi:hypothetical protein